MSPPGTTSCSGIVPAALSMFDANGRLDEDATGAHLDSLVRQGAHGLVVGGTSGEFIALSTAERARLITVAVRIVAGRVPVVAGTGVFGTQATIDLTLVAADAGADAAIVILPYYQRPTSQEVVEHFHAIGARSPIPVIVYNNPGNSGAPELTASELAMLYRAGHIQGVKCTAPTVHQVHEARLATDEGFRVFYGSFMAPLEALAGGAHGWISGILNVALPDALALYDAMGRGDLVAARQAWSRIRMVRNIYVNQALGPVSDLAIYRGILEWRGQPGGHCRAPLQNMSPSQRDRLAALLGQQPASVGSGAIL